MQQATGTARERTVGLDLGDRTSRFCILDQDGATLEEGGSPRLKRPYAGGSLRWTGLESPLRSGPTRPGWAAS